MTDNSFIFGLAGQLRTLADQGIQRDILPVRPKGTGCLQYQGNEYLNLAGNDYLGLAGNLPLLKKFYTSLEQQEQLIEQFGLGSGASRLMSGSHEQYAQLEEGLAQYYAKDRALIFNSGYHINIGLLPALTQKGDLIFADKLCHASLIDGMHLSQARMIRFPHLDYDHLEQLLQKHHTAPRGPTASARDKKKNIFIVTESIFSMDGDCADLPTLVRLKERYGAVLYVDEAHSVGVCGQQGLGLAEEQKVLDRIDLLIGTFGKAWGGQGAFVVCEETIYTYLVNTARSLIFTTALPPVNIHWLNFILPIIRTMNNERQALKEMAKKLRLALHREGLQTCGESHIVPVMIGAEKKAVTVAEHLRQQGIWIQAVRTPTVPGGTARLRLSLTTVLKAKQLATLPKQIAKIAKKSPSSFP